jgi:Ca2+-binding EF-hand superfamily protein
VIFAARHGQVLKALEGSQWDDASVDELLAAADESGDGELQVEDRWF